MGCVSSKQDINDIHPNIFNVLNVDDEGRKLNQGQLEITDTKLVFYQKGKEPIRWPLRCLRRYGFEQELFSFESGRKSDTGPGIYAFKCAKAERLFNLLQSKVRSQRDPSIGSLTRPERPATAVSAAGAPQNAATAAVQDNAQLPPNTPPILEHNQEHNASNTFGRQTAQGNIDVDQEVFLNPSSTSATTGTVAAGPVYINLQVNDHVRISEGDPTMPTFPAPRAPTLSIADNPPLTPMGFDDPRHDYENVGVSAGGVTRNGAGELIGGELPLPPKPQKPILPKPSVSDDPLLSNGNCNGVSPGGGIYQHSHSVASKNSVSEEQEETRKLNYIEVVIPPAKSSPSTINRSASNDVNSHNFSNMTQSASSVHSEQNKNLVSPSNGISDLQMNGATSRLAGSASATGNESGYAIIDIDKTVALIKCTNPDQVDDNEEQGTRTTRHNSTLSDLPFMTSLKRNSVISN